MTESEQKIDFHDELNNLPDLDDMLDIDLDLTDDLLSEEHHNRKTVRYIRNDFKIALVYSNPLGLKKSLSSELNDISTKGALVTTEQKFGINKKITLVLTFDSGKIFEIKGKIIRNCPSGKHRYGIKFEKQENHLGDYLLETQTDLVFR